MKKSIDLRDPLYIQADIFDRMGWSDKAFALRFHATKLKKEKGDRVIDDSVQNWFQFGKEGK